MARSWGAALTNKRANTWGPQSNSPSGTEFCPKRWACKQVLSQASFELKQFKLTSLLQSHEGPWARGLRNTTAPGFLTHRNRDTKHCCLKPQSSRIICYTVRVKVLVTVVSDCSPPGSSTKKFSRQAYWSGLPFPSLGLEPRSPALQADSLPSEPQGRPISSYCYTRVHH